MRPLDPRVLPHLRPARLPLAVVGAGQVLGALLVVVQAFALAALVVRLVGGTSWATPAVVLAAALAGRALCTVAVDVASASAAARVGEHLRGVVLRRALDLPATELARHRTGELGLLATRGVAAVEPYLTRYLPALVLAAVLPPLVLVAIVSQDRWAALVVVLTLPLVPVFAALIGLATQDRVDRQWRLFAQLSGHFVDVVRGLPTLVTHRRARAQRERIAEMTDRYRRAHQDVLKLAFASSAVLELVATLSVALVAVLVGLRLAAGGLPLETALVVLLLAPEAYWPLRRVGAEFHAAAEGTATFEALHELLDGAPAPDRGLAVPRGEVVLDDVAVTWPGRDRPAVAGVSTVLPATGLVAVTGPSGCGKSTLLAALAGEVPIAAGAVRVAGADLGDLDPAAWRAAVAVLPQRPWLRDGTVADNVRLGRPDATDAEVRDALAVVGLPFPLDHALGEDGAALSAGQRARLAMARVVVSDRPVVLLDEPTAHLDAVTERVLLGVVRRLAATRLVVAVAHRPALVEAADVVLALPGVSTRPSQGSVRLDHRPPPAVEPRSEPAPMGLGRPWLPRLLAVLAASSGVALTATAGWLIVKAAEHPPVLTLMVAIVGVRTFGLARPVFRYAERLRTHDVALRLLAERRARVYADLVPLVPGRLGRRRGDLLASVVDDVDGVVDEEVRVRLPWWTWLGTTVLTSAVVAWMLPAAGLALLVGGLLAGVGAWALARWGATRHAAARVAARAALSRRVVETLNDARPLVQWQADARALAEVAAVGAELGRATRAAARWVAPARAWPLLVAGAGVLVAAALAGGAVSGPVAALLVLVPLALADVTTPMADAGVVRQETRAAAARLASLCTLEPAVTDPERPAPVPGDAVSVTDVTATWDGAPALPPTSLRAEPGRAVGVVGPSGSGKSTLAAVLVRHLGPSSGAHEVGGADVGTLAADDVRSRVGLLDDDPYLFASTLAENVRLARPGATDADVEGALRAAHLGPWLDALPDGLATRVGDGGSSVSGGERARIGLARLLLGGQSVLVLDEPTAHLDADTARDVTDDLLALRDGGHGLVWITHREADLESLDDVIAVG